MSGARRLAPLAFEAAERGLVPDGLVRAGVRRLARSRLRAVGAGGGLDEGSLGRGPIAPAPEAANEQHYEVPPEFFGLVLGPWRKYSCGLWPEGAETLEASELAMLRATADMAGIGPGQDILDLGCGWGAFSLFAAGEHPSSRVLGVSNSSSQREHILSEARARGLANLDVRTADVNDLELPDGAFDRIVSVEMFEHMSNYEALLARTRRWLRPDGKLFIHVFCHREHAYRFTTEGAGDWMAREFFTGGLMPSLDLLPRLARGFELEERRFYRGTHYQKTSEAWLDRLDGNRDAVTELFARTYGPDEAPRRVERWRLFFLACAETFGLDEGRQWGVAHYRFSRGDTEPAEAGRMEEAGDTAATETATTR
ncbi:MAG: cyclopropane-fatty-acyl-phospholipid synthase family protein [Gemmatimonadota bacterium]|nr:cyclopropane-fatty-acyl-phospholipid synthase family protein [Gemmatimonadota bacterium]